MTAQHLAEPYAADDLDDVLGPEIARDDERRRQISPARHRADTTASEADGRITP